MTTRTRQPVAIVGVGTLLPDAPDVPAFWDNVCSGRYSIGDVPTDRWDPELFWDSDPKAPDKSYSRIGGWVRDYAWNPLEWRLPIPPKVGDAMDRTQKWAVLTARQALLDAGWPDRPLDAERTAVILGNAMAGDRHYQTANRLFLPEILRDLEASPRFAALGADDRNAVAEEFAARVRDRLPAINEDTMPGELANIIAGRIANLFDFQGPNFVCDAACASAMAALSAAVEGLDVGDFDAVVTGGVDANMSASTFIKFCKIGALSATGTRPYGDGADGFVMGEGAALFVLKRLADAERDGDRVYAVIRAVAGSSDGRGKGITAPNPRGQELAVERAWATAGLSPADVSLIEGHGTSTKVGDVVEFASLNKVFGGAGLDAASVPLGSVKSNIGHLKGAAGAAGVLKAALALHHKVLPPSLNCETPNPNLELDGSPFRLHRELEDWTVAGDRLRRAGVSAFGFGGTNFHVVLEEHAPGRNGNGHRATVAVQGAATATVPGPASSPAAATPAKAPLRGALVLGGDSREALAERLRAILAEAGAGRAPAPAPPAAADLAAPVRLALDYGDGAELVKKGEKALVALLDHRPGMWRALRAQGVHLGEGLPGPTAFLYTGQGSQYAGMAQEMAAREPIVAETFAEADRVMTPILGRPLTSFLFVDADDEAAVAQANRDLMQTEITQPAVLSVDVALTRLLAAYGITPDLVMGHSLGEYGALVAAGCIPFTEALEAVSARGREMSHVSVADKGAMAAVFAPLEEIEATLASIDGYVVVANLNSGKQAVIGGATEAVERAAATFRRAGHEVRPLPVSHAFHTDIVAPASAPLRDVLDRLSLAPPRIPVAANATGDFYPSGPDALEAMKDLLARQIASPVQFVAGLETLYGAGARNFVEVGPKRALVGFVEDVLGHRDGVQAFYTNHPKAGEVASFNQALCGLYALGLGRPADAAPRSSARPASWSASAIPAVTATPGTAPGSALPEPAREPTPKTPTMSQPPTPTMPAGPAASSAAPASGGALSADRYGELGRVFADFLDRGFEIYKGSPGPAASPSAQRTPAITGAGLGLPGTERVFDDAQVGRLLRGENFLDAVPTRFRDAMVERNIVRVVKDETGSGSFETIGSPADVLKLAARAGAFDLEHEFGVPAERVAALDRTTQLALGAGLEALRDAGIPLALRYKATTRGTWLPDRWGLPDALRDDTGVIFASAFPGYDALTDEMERFHADRARRLRLAELEELRGRFAGVGGLVVDELERRIGELQQQLREHTYHFDRRFLFRVLSMGHSQFAELIGARGPNTQVNAACASTTQAVSLAEEWVRHGRCRRVVVISADDITSDALLPWFGAGFLASGAAATDDVVAEAALPFDRRRHGLLIGMGAAALVVEDAEAAAERALEPIATVAGSIAANSAFHGSRLDVGHIVGVMERLVADAEARWGVDRRAMAARTVFVSHETYTPARGGSAQAEVEALRKVFGDAADRIVIANTKGFTGHAMGTGIEDVLAVKALETGLVPPVANFREVDPDLGSLNLSRGGLYPVEWALRLGAGFGSQIAMTLTRRASARPQRPRPEQLGFAYRVQDRARWEEWLRRVSGQEAPQLEVAHRTLRLKDQGAPKTAPERAAVTARPAATPATLDTLSTAAPATLAAPAASAPAPSAGPAVPASTPSPTPTSPAQPPTSPEEAAPAAVSKPVLSPVEGGGVQPEPPAATKTTPSFETPAEAGSSGLLGGTDPVEQQVLAIVAEQTGYPSDMLDLDLDLEADLGIDTVKQAETFAAIRGAWDIERDEDLKLRDYPTLRHAVGFVYEKRPDLKPQPPTSPEEAATAAVSKPVPSPVEGGGVQPEALVPASTTPSFETPAEAGSSGLVGGSDPVEQQVLAIVAEQTGYPPEMLDLDLDLEADLGIDTVKQAETFAAIRGAWDIERDEDLKLRDYPTLRHAVGFVYEKRPDLKQQAPAPQPPTRAEEAATAAVSKPVLSPVEGPGVPPEAPVPASTTPSFETPAEAGSSGLIGGSDPVEQQVLAIVAEQTGYPPEMLDLDLDLEADLGIDTVKQAETFAAIRGAWDIERDEDLKLRDYPTLRHAVGFVYEKRPDLKPAAATAPTSPTSPTPTPTSPEEAAPAAVSKGGAPEPTAVPTVPTVPRRIPTAVLRPALDLCRSTGIGLAEGDRVILFPDAGGVGRALAGRLETRGVEVLQIDGAPSAEELETQLRTWADAAPIHGLYWLPALDGEGDPASLGADQRREALRVRAELLYTALRTLYGSLGEPGTFLVSATRLGGRHGYDPEGAVAPLGGAVTGLTKTFHRERPGALVKAVDFPTSRKTAAYADLLIAETLADPGAVEVGRTDDGRRWTVTLREVALEDDADAGEPMELGADSVFLVTGAAGSIVSAITADLARGGGTFHLLDLTPEPDRDDPDLARFESDRDGLKRDLFQRIQERGERATPAKVERELARLERSAAALAAIRAVETAGGTVHWYRVDLTDGDAVAAAVARVLEESGRVDVLLHAAGLEISHLLPDKTPEEFGLVFGVKAHGWLHLLAALGDAPVGAALLFGSIAGRFGNAGQADYAAANDLLAKTASAFRRYRPNSRALTLDWTAWGGIGMATRGSIPKMMEAAGIEMLPPESGIAVIRREIEGGGRGEQVVALALGAMLDEAADGGLELADDGPWGERARGAGPMVGRVAGMPVGSGLRVVTRLDPAEQPFLDDHRIDGTPVLPGVMGLESFAEAAAVLLPDHAVAALEDVEFLAPFKFYRGEPREVTVEVQVRHAGDGDEALLADCRLLGYRTLPGSDEPQETVHFTGRLRLVPADVYDAPEARVDVSVLEGSDSRPQVTADDVYRLYFHGPAYRVLGRAWRRDGHVVGHLSTDLPPNHRPETLPTRVAPRWIELAFQTAGLWEMGVEGALGLPHRIDRLVVPPAGTNGPGQDVLALVEPRDGGYDARLVDPSGRVLAELRGYRTVRLPGGLDEAALAPLKKAVSD